MIYIILIIIAINLIYLRLYLKERAFKKDYEKFDKQMEREGIWIGKKIDKKHNYEIKDIYYSNYKNDTIVNFRIEDVEPAYRLNTIIDYDTLKEFKNYDGNY